MELLKASFRHDLLTGVQELYRSHQSLLEDPKYSRSRVKVLELMKVIAMDSQEKQDLSTIKSFGKTAASLPGSGRKRIVNFERKSEDASLDSDCTTGDCGGTAEVNNNFQLSKGDIRKKNPAGTVFDEKEQEYPHKQEDKPEPVVAGLDDVLEAAAQSIADGVTQAQHIGDGVTQLTKEVSLRDREETVQAVSTKVDVEEKVKGYDDVGECLNAKEVAIFFGAKNPNLKTKAVITSMCEVIGGAGHEAQATKFKELRASKQTIDVVSTFFFEKLIQK